MDGSHVVLVAVLVGCAAPKAPKRPTQPVATAASSASAKHAECSATPRKVVDGSKLLWVRTTEHFLWWNDSGTTRVRALGGGPAKVVAMPPGRPAANPAHMHWCDGGKLMTADEDGSRVASDAEFDTCHSAIGFGGWVTFADGIHAYAMRPRDKSIAAIGRSEGLDVTYMGPGAQIWKADEWRYTDGKSNPRDLAIDVALALPSVPGLFIAGPATAGQTALSLVRWSTGKPEVVAHETESVSDLAALGQDLYWSATTGNGGSVHRLRGGHATSLVPTTHRPESIDVTDDCIYFVDGLTNAIFNVTR